MSVSCYFSGRWGNIVFHAAHMIAYAKKYNLPFFFPTEAMAYNDFRNGDISVPFYIPSTGEHPIDPIVYQEPNMAEGIPRYHRIRKMNNVLFDGYFQSFRYFDWCRDYILETFNFPYKRENIVSISVRRGDCLEALDKFPIAPLEYYQNSVKFMQQRGFNKFKIHSDDIQWCKSAFTEENFGDAEMQFYEGHSESENYFSLMGCEHNITARSTFSLTAAWFNQNPDKIVLVPTLRHKWWGAQNRDFLTGTNFIQIDFEDPENKL